MKKTVQNKFSDLTDDELVRREFMRRFSTWNIPIEALQTTLDKLPNETRQAHYIDLHDILEKPAFKREVDDWKRRVARTLAMGLHNGREISEVEKQGLRQTLIEIENFEETIRKRATLRTSLKSLRPLSSKI